MFDCRPKRNILVRNWLNIPYVSVSAIVLSVTNKCLLHLLIDILKYQTLSTVTKPL